MPEVQQRVELVRHSLDGEALVALAAKLCYAGGDLDSLLEKIAANDQRDFLRKVREMGHESVLEHVSFTFLTEGVSRALLAQLTRLFMDLTCRYQRRLNSCQTVPKLKFVCSA